MNRRTFLGDLIKAGVGFAILPSATTYQRVWVKKRILWEIDWQDIQVGTGVVEFVQSDPEDIAYQLKMMPTINCIGEDFAEKLAFTETVLFGKPISRSLV